MDILRLAISSLIAAALLLGCDNNSTNFHPKDSPTTQLQIVMKQGESKSYWIQSYSVITQDDHANWSSNNTIGTELLVDYQVQKIQDQQIDLNVLTKHSQLLIKGWAAYPNLLIQTVLSNGMQYQLKIGNDQPQTIKIDNLQLQQTINKSTDLNSEYQYLQFVIAAPFIPASIPLIQGQEIIINNFMGLNKLSVHVDKINDKTIEVTLQNTAQTGQLYGKAILNKDSGWIKKMALVKEAPVAGKTNYNMRTILLMGPPEWSSDNKHQLITEMNSKNSKQYTHPFPIFGFDKQGWQQKQQQVLATKATEGKLFTLNTPDGASQLMLMYNNGVGTVPNPLGQYKVDNVMTDGHKTPTLLAAPNLLFNNLAASQNINIATYKPIHDHPTVFPTKLNTIKTVSAQVSFIPFQLETITLGVSKNKSQHAMTQDNSFSISITPTNQAKTYLLSWQAKDNINFSIDLIKGAENALVQFIQPETIKWLTPSESRIINSLNTGYQNSAQITFTNEVPAALNIFLLKPGSKAAYSYPVTFKRN